MISQEFYENKIGTELLYVLDCIDFDSDKTIKAQGTIPFICLETSFDPNKLTDDYILQLRNLCIYLPKKDDVCIDQDVIMKNELYLFERPGIETTFTDYEGVEENVGGCSYKTIPGTPGEFPSRIQRLAYNWNSDVSRIGLLHTFGIIVDMAEQKVKMGIEYAIVSDTDLNISEIISSRVDSYFGNRLELMRSKL